VFYFFATQFEYECKTQDLVQQVSYVLEVRPIVAFASDIGHIIIYFWDRIFKSCIH